MSRTGINDDQAGLSGCFPKTIQESAELEAYYPPLPWNDEIYEPIKERARIKAYQRLARVMVDGSTYSVKRVEEIRAPMLNEPQDHVMFVITLTYIAAIDAIL